MKIDLHCHTKNTKNKESDLRNVSVEKFKVMVEHSEVKFLAITNHNCFFKDNYKELKEAVKDLCYVMLYRSRFRWLDCAEPNCGLFNRCIFL